MHDILCCSGAKLRHHLTVTVGDRIVGYQAVLIQVGVKIQPLHYLRVIQRAGPILVKESLLPAVGQNKHKQVFRRSGTAPQREIVRSILRVLLAIRSQVRNGSGRLNALFLMPLCVVPGGFLGLAIA